MNADTTNNGLDGLTLKQRLFVEAYLGEAAGNGTEACRLAGYQGSDDVLCTMARYNLAHPRISSVIRARVQEAAMAADGVLLLLVQEATTAAKARDRIKALELLGKYHKLFTDRVEHAGKVTLAEARIKAAAARGLAKARDFEEGGGE